MSNIIHFKNIEIEKLQFSSIFGTSKYLKCLGSEFGGINSGNLKLAYYTNSRFGIKRLTVTALEIPNEVQAQEYNNELDKITTYLKNNEKVACITCPPSFVVFPFPYKNGVNAEFGTVLKNLEATEEEIFQDIHGKHRNKIRKGIKENLIVQKGNHLKDDCYNTIAGTLIREGVYFETKNEFDELCHSLGENVEFFVVKRGNDIQGAAVIPYNESCAFYIWGGSVQKPATGAMNFMHWEIMKAFKSLNVKNYDFVGIRLKPKKNTKLEGLKSFKVRFGGEVKEGFLWKANLKPLHCFIFKLLYILKNKALPSDIIESENKNTFDA